MTLPEWAITLITAAYTSNLILGLIGYVPQLLMLWWHYKTKTQEIGVSLPTYVMWSIGAFNTGAFGLFVVQRWEMALVGYATLLLNITVIGLVLLIRGKPHD